MSNRIVAAAIAAAIMMYGARAQAGLGFSTTGAAVGIAAPPNAKPNALESDTSVFVWLEGQGAQSGPVEVDHDGSDVDFPSDEPIGAVVNGPFCSYLIHMDSVKSNKTITLSGSVTFMTKILGVIFTAPNLQGSNHLGAPTEFAGGNGHLEDDEDCFSISGTTLTFQLTAKSGKTDQIRVLTAVPEPASFGVFAVSGLVSLGIRRLRRRRS